MYAVHFYLYIGPWRRLLNWTRSIAIEERGGGEKEEGWLIGAASALRLACCVSARRGWFIAAKRRITRWNMKLRRTWWVFLPFLSTTKLQSLFRQNFSVMFDALCDLHFASRYRRFKRTGLLFFIQRDWHQWSLQPVKFAYKHACH